MSRYIDADALIKETWYVEIVGETIDDISEQIIRQCKRIVSDAPTIDAVSVVRCEECKYWNTKGCRDGVGECEWAYYMTEPNDFCSHGERSGE